MNPTGNLFLSIQACGPGRMRRKARFKNVRVASFSGPAFLNGEQQENHHGI
jgi:hypothetical protein